MRKEFGNGTVFVEVLVLYAKKVEELKEVLEFPQEMLVEFNQTLEQKSRDNESFVYISSRRLSTHKQPNQIREALMKGYVEMSQINLSICSECLHVEYEAEHMVERLVSGG
ncbi:transcriptional regulator [Ureibacillus sp. Re31]|uniref:Transcriptional regulator n=2 Tax=Ureibacillus galli TaxID=2762222 RepID=A0ABR8XBA5_9BACL|nr:transcriptional regulator [Ureibacillus galli]